MDKYNLSNVVLYAKGWYKITDNVWDDLIEILKLDDYTPFHKNDVYSILINSIDKKEFNSNFNQLKEIMFGIHPSECWKVGYYTKGCTWTKETNLPEYDMPTAFVYYILSSLRFINNDQWIPTTPKYKKYPKNPEVTLQKVIEHFNQTKIKPKV